MSRGVTLLRRSLNKLIRQNTKVPEGTQYAQWRKMLRGSALARTQACKKAREYLAVMTIERPNTKPLPTTLNGLVSELRKSSNNIRLHASMRIQSLEKLLRISGFSCGVHHGDTTDSVIDLALGLTAPVPEAPTNQRVRKGARSNALDEIRDTLRIDIESGAVRTLQDAVTYLRLPEMPAPMLDAGAKMLDEFNATMDRVLARAKGDTQ